MGMKGVGDGLCRRADIEKERCIVGDKLRGAAGDLDLGITV